LIAVTVGRSETNIIWKG